MKIYVYLKLFYGKLNILTPGRSNRLILYCLICVYNTCDIIYIVCFDKCLCYLYIYNISYCIQCVNIEKKNIIVVRYAIFNKNNETDLWKCDL